VQPATILAALAAPAASAEMFGDVPEATMFPAEAAAIDGAVAGRRREFASVRHCARRALRQIGVPAAPVLADAGGAPSWPAGVVGSMTHCSGYRAAAVAPSDRLRGIGIDAEPHAALPDPAPELVLRGSEREHVSELAAAHPELHWDLIAFCAKEAAFKACFPLTRRPFDFDELSVELGPDGTFRARLRVPDRLVGELGHGGLVGRWVVHRGLAATSVVVKP
jgi:4'-phosphopantetheinyl transferase EntD